MRLLFALLILFVALPCRAESGTNQDQDESCPEPLTLHSSTHEKGCELKDPKKKTALREGHWLFFSQKDHVTEEGDYLDGARQGLWIKYGRNGRKQFESTYKDDVLFGPHAEYYANEQPRETGVYANGKRNGVWTKYRESGSKTEECEYRDDKKNGKCLTFFENGVARQFETYVNGQKNGPFEKYYVTGAKKIEGAYLNDVRNGVFKAYDRSGTLVHQVEYVAGERVRIVDTNNHRNDEAFRKALPDITK